MLKLFKKGTFFAFMRYISGFGGWIPHAQEDDKLKIKFRNCIKHCFQIYQEAKELKKDEKPSSKTVRLMYASIGDYYGWELMAHRNSKDDCIDNQTTRVMIHK
jgi:hypothetical protein